MDGRFLSLLLGKQPLQKSSFTKYCPTPSLGELFSSHKSPRPRASQCDVMIDSPNRSVSPTAIICDRSRSLLPYPVNNNGKGIFQLNVN